MASGRAERLRKLLAGTKRTTDQAQAAFLKAEDGLSALEDREARRDSREQRSNAEVAERFPRARGRS